MGTSDFQIIHFSESVSIGTLLNAAAVVTNLLDGTNESGYRVKRMKIVLDYDGRTDGEGPLTVGLCGSLSPAEVAEVLAARPTSKFGRAPNEQANRPVWPIWQIPRGGVEAQGLTDDIQMYIELDDFMRVVNEGQELKFFVHNHSGSSMTTGMVVRVRGVMIGHWLDD